MRDNLTPLRLPIAALALVFACATAPEGPDRNAAPRAAQQAAPPAAPAATAPSPTADAPRTSPAPTAAKSAGLVLPDAPSGAAAARIAELSKRARPLVDAFLNTEARFTRDGKQVVVVSNRDGLPQLYVADATGATTR